MDRSTDTALAHIVMLTCRPKISDFRYDLAREFHALGHPVTYIFLKRRPEVTDLASGTVEGWSIGRLVGFFARMRHQRADTVVFQSTNLILPALILLLRRLSGVRWVFDMHDDLLYAKTGLARRRAQWAQAVMVGQADLTVHAAHMLQRLFPHSHHIGNGSSLEPRAKTTTDPNRVLILASLDERIDLPLLTASVLACPDRHFHVHGRIATHDPTLRKALEHLFATTPNLTYHGPYTDRDLPDLLAGYLVTFAPYQAGSILTDYIEPLRYHHCLASQVGIVSTSIPAAIEMGERIERIEEASELAAALDRAVVNRHGGHRTWHMVAKRLQSLLMRTPPA